MEINKFVSAQKIFLVIISFGLIYYSFMYYKPWLEAFFTEDLSKDSLNNTTPRFYSQVFIETLRFILSCSILYVIYLYNRFLSNVGDLDFFNLKNSQYLTKGGYFLIYYSLSIYIFKCLGDRDHLFNIGYVEAYKQKQENDLTI